MHHPLAALSKRRKEMMDGYSPPAPLLLTRREAARLLGVSVDTIAHLIQAGELRGVRIGKSVRVPRHELNALIERGRARTKDA